MKMTEEQLLGIIQTEFRDAMGADGGEISLERAKAWDYYLRKPLGNEVDGESQVVTSDVADVINSIMPSLLRMFTTEDNLVSFDPVGEEDVPLARQESEYVNYTFFKQNPAFTLLYNWFFDALAQMNGIVMQWWDESEDVSEETYKNKDTDELAILLDDEELEPLEREENADGTHNVTFRRVSKAGRVQVDNVPPEEYRISSDARDLDPCKARMVGRERDITRSDLIEMGFDKDVVMDLPATKTHTVRVNEDSSRRDKSDDRNGKAQDKSQELVHVREAYIRVDFDGDGRSELRQIFEAGSKILSNEVVDRQPFHVICPRPLPHKHFGRSMAEEVMDLQEVSTTLLRQVLNNLYHTNNPRHGISEVGMSENTLDDLLTNRVGGVVRFGRDPSQSYVPMTVPFTAGQSFPMIEYFEKVKRDRTGISSDGEGLSPEALKNIQQSVLANSLDLSKMKVEAIARCFSETGIKTLFLHRHELLIKHQKKEDVFLLRNQFVQVNPSEWRTRKNVTVNVGLGLGTRQQNLMDLEAIWQKQAQMVENGGMNLTVMPRQIYNTAAEIVRNTMKNPDLFFTDPGDAMAPPQPSEQEQLQKMQMEIEQRRQELDAMKREIDQARLMIERDKILMEHERKSFELKEQAEAREDKFMAEMERVKNDIEKLKLAEREMGIKERESEANVLLKRAQTLEAVERARAADLENDSVESGVVDLLEDLADGTQETGT